MNVILTIDLIEQFYLIPTVHEAPIWRFRLWVKYVKKLPFMIDHDHVYNANPFDLNNIIIDNRELYKVPKNNWTELRSRPFSFMVTDGEGINDACFIHWEFSWPAFQGIEIESGTLYGFSWPKSFVMGHTQYYPELIEVPGMGDEVDILSYSKMKFNSMDVPLINDKGQLDNIQRVFGNEANILVQEKDGAPWKSLQQFYIENYKMSLNEVVLSLKDKRERLATKAPFEKLSNSTLLYLNENLNGKLIPDAYGYCFGVEGICLNELQATSDNWRHYKFSRTITSNLMDTDFIIEAEIGKKWTRLPRNASEWSSLGYGAGGGSYNATTMAMTVNKTVGTVSIPVVWAHEEGNVQKGVNKVRLSAHFNAPTNPADIIVDIFSYYADIPFLTNNFDIPEWNAEKAKLYPVGIVMDKEQEIWKWVEMLQPSSILGFQLMTNFNLFTIRVDDPNRTISKKIVKEEIINQNEIEIDFDAERYASYTNIGYAYHWQMKSSQEVVDKTQRALILKRNRWDKELKNQSYMKTYAQAERKGKIFLADFLNLLPIVSNIKVQGFDYFSLRVYDIIEIDLTFNERIRNIMQVRQFGGIARGQIVKIEKNIMTEEVTLSIRYRIVNQNVP